MHFVSAPNIHLLEHRPITAFNVVFLDRGTFIFAVLFMKCMRAQHDMHDCVFSHFFVLQQTSIMVSLNFSYVVINGSLRVTLHVALIIGSTEEVQYELRYFIGATQTVITVSRCMYMRHRRVTVLT